ncbi:hypothetical protein [Caldimonas brevitalea]|uniref:hypothetical protein n=1 Tax=Caldimonas brevitalea TaxID=413882 RepID=UPI0012F930CC|nr:hypothetical protein [Caldimonas brevitalea]
MSFQRCISDRGGETPCSSQLTRVVGGLAAAAMVAVVTSACTRPDITLADFSKTIQLDPKAAEGQVVGLYLEIDLDAKAPITVNLACEGKVKTKQVVPPGRSVQRWDWYSWCAELSFEVGNAQARSIAISYEFHAFKN